MPNQVLSSVENTFNKGLVTESTGLNFPENAATDTSNCIYTLVGDVTRREGIDYEANFAITGISRTNKAISSYKWNNAGGDGQTQIVVSQIGNTLYFYKSSIATVGAPLSTQLLASTVNLSSFLAVSSTADPSIVECQYADGNGYLFIYHPNLDPIYCAYNLSNSVITAKAIEVKIRDFGGTNEFNVPFNYRNPALTLQHSYNLINQGWVLPPAWNGTSSSSITPAMGLISMTVPAGMTVTLGENAIVTSNADFNCLTSTGVFRVIPAGQTYFTGTVTFYSGTTMTINVYALYPLFTDSVAAAYVLSNFISSGNSWIITPNNLGYAAPFHTALNTWPSNSDAWWYFKDSTGVFSTSASVVNNLTINSGPAPKGHVLINAFNQQRSLIAGISGLTPITTNVRPQTGTWYQGRVWYAGVNDSQVASGTANFYSWTENIYFSQIINDSTQFGNCFQTNDPTSEILFGLLPSDGGVIQIQGCGAIYKLFPLQNALLVFAANGVWYITGSQGIGFSANDYTIVKLSSVQSISSTSFVDVQGLPMFWNEEGIYKVEPAKQGSSLLSSPLHVNPLEVNPITVGTILTFYNAIPIASKKYVKGAYHPIDYTVQWIYKSTSDSGVTDRYSYDRILNFNTVNNAFYPHTIQGIPNICSILYVSSPGGTNTPDPVFKYFTATPTGFTFSEERDDTFVDWFSYDAVGVNFTSYFITGYKLHGQGQRRFQIPYIYVYSRGSPTSYKIQGLWDYGTTGNSGRWSVLQTVNNNNFNFSVIARRHKLRGQGLVLQIKVISVDGQPFDIIGWSTFETQNTGV